MAFYFAFVAVSLLFPTEADRFVETSVRVGIEALVVLTGGCLAYAAWGLFRYIGRRPVRWPLIVCAYVAGVVLTPVAWAVLLANFSGG